MRKFEVSEIQIVPVKPKEGLVAFASCVINQSFYIGNIAIYTSPKRPEGYRLVYPSRVLPNGKEINCVCPINRDTGDFVSAAIISKFREIITKVSG